MKLSSTQKYRRTINGFLGRLYTRMERRTRGLDTNRPHLYIDKKIVSRDTFYKWSRTNPDFLNLFKRWANCDHDLRLTPSVNRINSKKGYTLSNMEWVNLSQNCGLATVTKRLKDKEKQMIYKIAGVRK